MRQLDKWDGLLGAFCLFGVAILLIILVIASTRKRQKDFELLQTQSTNIVITNFTYDSTITRYTNTVQPKLTITNTEFLLFNNNTMILSPNQNTWEALKKLYPENLQTNTINIY